MSENYATYKHVSRGVFDNVSDRISKDDSLKMAITICYNGTNLYGDLSIEANAGHSKEYKKALQIFNEEYCG